MYYRVFITGGKIIHSNTQCRLRNLTLKKIIWLDSCPTVTGNIKNFKNHQILLCVYLNSRDPSKPFLVRKCPGSPLQSLQSILLLSCQILICLSIKKVVLKTFNNRHYKGSSLFNQSKHKYPIGQWLSYSLLKNQKLHILFSTDFYNFMNYTKQVSQIAVLSYHAMFSNYIYI